VQVRVAIAVAVEHDRLAVARLLGVRVAELLAELVDVVVSADAVLLGTVLDEHVIELEVAVGVERLRIPERHARPEHAVSGW
jgi:hypothetical protein